MLECFTKNKRKKIEETFEELKTKLEIGNFIISEIWT